MKKNKYLFLVLILSTIPLLYFIFNPLLFHTHDGLVHIPRIAAFYKALADGQFPVRWAGDLNYRYGMPLFNFIYQVPYFIASFFVFLGLGLAWSFKITLALSFLLSGVFAYLFGQSFFQDSRKAFLFAICYQFFPFRFIELLVRGSFGEVYTYTFLPLVLFGLSSTLQKPTRLSIVCTILGTVLLILSHNAVSLLFFVVCTGFIVFFRKKKVGVVSSVVGLILGLLVSCFYWLPAIVEHKYTYGDLFMKSLYIEHFAPFFNFFLPNFTNSSSLQTGGISVWIGLIHTLIIFISVWMLVQKKLNGGEKSVAWFGLLCVGVALFFMQPISRLLWESIALLRQFQFPWRFLAVVGFGTSLLIVVFIKYVKNQNIYFLLIACIVFSTVFYWRPSLGYDKIDEDYYWNFPLNTTYYGETDVIWSAGPAKTYAKEPVEFVSGKGDITAYTKKSSIHTFNVQADVDSYLLDNTQYFPGWKVLVDGKPVSIQFQDVNWRGLITFPVAKGNHTVRVVFGESKLRQIADAVSLLGLVVTILVLYKKPKQMYG